MDKMTNEGSVVDVCNTRVEANEELQQLKKSGFDTTKLSVVGENSNGNKNIIGYFSSGDRLKPWGKAAAFIAGVGRMLFGTGLFDLGLAENSFKSYAKSLKLGKFLVITRDNAEAAADARESLGVAGTV
jgi:hypothetical protein